MTIFTASHWPGNGAACFAPDIRSCEGTTHAPSSRAAVPPPSADQNPPLAVGPVGAVGNPAPRCTSTARSARGRVVHSVHGPRPGTDARPTRLSRLDRACMSRPMTCNHRAYASGCITTILILIHPILYTCFCRIVHPINCHRRSHAGHPPSPPMADSPSSAASPTPRPGACAARGSSSWVSPRPNSSRNAHPGDSPPHPSLAPLNAPLLVRPRHGSPGPSSPRLGDRQPPAMGLVLPHTLPQPRPRRMGRSSPPVPARRPGPP